MALKEIVRPDPYRRPHIKGENCPHCDVPTVYQLIPCPDGRSGCIVLHYGWHCDQCGRDFTTVSEQKETGG